MPSWSHLTRTLSIMVTINQFKSQCQVVTIGDYVPMSRDLFTPCPSYGEKQTWNGAGYVVSMKEILT